MKICSKYNIYIIFITFTGLLTSMLYGLDHNKTFLEVKISYDNFSNHYLIHEFWNFLGTFIIAIMFISNENKSSNKKSVKKKNNKNNKTWITLIYNKNNGYNYKDKTNSFICFYFLTIFFWVLIDHLIEYYYLILQDLDFWMVELFIIVFLTSKTEFKIQFYKHHKFAMLLSIIPSLLKIVSIILSFYDEDKNYTGGLPIYYVEKNPILSITIGIIFYIGLLNLRSCIYLYFKWYMDIKYISPNKILFAFGGIGIISYFIICLLSTFFECKSINFNNLKENNINYCDYLGKVINNKTDSNTTYYYFDNFNIYFQNFDNTDEIFGEILVIFIGILTFFF